MSAAAISVCSLSKTFSSAGWLRHVLGSGAACSGRDVLQAVSFDVPAGQIFGLLGANGAGKSTLVEILATQQLPTRGVARICGYDVIADVSMVRRLTGYCPATADSFYPRLAVEANLEFFAILYGLAGTSAKNRIDAALGAVNLADQRGTQFQKLSQGMKQRLGIARALLMDPPVLLLDEPSRSLDPAAQRELHAFLRNFVAQPWCAVNGTSSARTILLVTHSLEEAATLCHRVGILSRGRIVAEGTAAEIMQHSGTSSFADAFARLAGHEIEETESEVQP